MICLSLEGQREEREVCSYSEKEEKEWQAPNFFQVPNKCQLL
jgi:hypothetical protein